MKKTTAAGFLICILIIFSPVTAPADDRNAAEVRPPAEGAPADFLTEVNKMLANPVSEIWSIGFEQNNYLLDTDPDWDRKWSSDLTLQPVIPISLTEDWNLITRPVLPLFVTQLYASTQPGSSRTGIETSTGFGDISLTEMLAPTPRFAGNWLFGVGPTFIFPTASTDVTGQGKWQIGPAGVAGYLSENWLLGFFAQNRTSFAGDRSRPDTNSLNLRPIATLFFPDGWSVGYSGNILANWKTDSRSVWTVPLGVDVGKVVRPGVKIDVAVQWMPVHPDNFGQKWNLQISISSVIPKLIRGPLFERGRR